MPVRAERTFVPQLREKLGQVRVGEQLRPGEQRVQVKPLAAQTAHRQPVLAVVADERRLSPVQ